MATAKTSHPADASARGPNRQDGERLPPAGRPFPFLPRARLEARDDSRAVDVSAIKGKNPPFWWPLAFLLAGTAFFRLTSADMVIARVFYAGGDIGWPYLEAQPWKTLYDAGCLPGLALGIGGLIVGLLGLAWSRLRPYRQGGIFLGLLLALGPGLLVNGLYKPHWGRPRPNQIVEFGGDRPFLPVLQKGHDSDCRSFPSGHASMGFFLMAPAFLLYRRRPRLGQAFFFLGLAGGCLMGLTRIVGGRHFASDVLWSAAFVYFCGLGLYYLDRLLAAHFARRKRQRTGSSPRSAEIWA